MNSPICAAQESVPEEPYLIKRPERQTIPLVFASPHSGQQYPDQLLLDARMDPIALRRSEDSFVDELFAAAPAHGAPLIAASFPRVWCDVNREAWELDPAMFADPLPPWVNSSSPRVGAGLGTLARIVTGGEQIYRRTLSCAAAEARLRAWWERYHGALAGLIAETRARFGYCLLIDCHSMPAHPAHLANPPHFVLGDAHATACTPRATRLVEEALL
ncbi:MAG: N-formylglutamate amidohydrolase, partial [bacterium]